MFCRTRLTVFSVVTLLAAVPAFSATSVQGWMSSEGVTGRPASPAHNWDREIVYLIPTTGGGPAYGFRMLAMEPGWFLLEPPGGFPAGSYTMFSMNHGSIDGGSAGFEYAPPISIPGGAGAVENLQFRTQGDYSVMYNRSYTEWAAEPWIWGSDFYQTFVATSTSVTRIATKLAGKDDDIGTGHLSVFLDFAIYETNGGPPSTWSRISPIRDVYLPGTMDPIIHILDVNYLSSEVPLMPGEEYAARFWVGPGSQCTQMAMVARPDNGSGYAEGKMYVGDTPYDGWDVYGYITGGAPGTLCNFNPINQVNPGTDELLGWRGRHGQTFVASGTSLAGVEFLYTVGCNPNPSLPVTISIYDGFGGAQIGSSRTCYTVTDLCQGRAAAFWEQGAVPLVPGETYYVEFNSSGAGGVNVWGMASNIPGVGAYIDGVSVGDTDLVLSIAEYESDVPITPRPTATFTPTPTPVIQANLLLNGDMELGETGTSGQVPDYWTKWLGTGNPTYWYNDNYGVGGSRGTRLIGGAINGQMFDSGWYQLVSALTPGANYGLLGWVRIVPGLTSQYEAFIGYDLTGQTSSGSLGSVQYTRVGGPNDTFVPMPLQTFVATGSSVSIWMRARNTSTSQVFYADFDDLMLYEIGGATSTPTFTPTRTPTPTLSLPDRDGDGIVDSVEGGAAPSAGQTSGYLRDSDGDGLDDGVEDANRNGIHLEGGETDPRERDTDTDQYEDGIEALLVSSSPLDPGDPSTPFADADGDSLPDDLDPNTSSADADGDRFTDGYEAAVLGLTSVTAPGTKPGLGDAQVNGSWDNGDAQYILNFFARQPAPDIDPSRSDLDRNGIIDNADAQRSLNYFARMDPYLPVE